MIKRLVVWLFVLFLPTVASAAVAMAPIATGPVTISGALFDKYAKATTTTTILHTQGIQAYTITAHDSNYTYSYPLCANATMVEVNGTQIQDPTDYIIGDSLTLSVVPNAASTPAACISRIVRQSISRGPSGGECLQNFQVKHQIIGAPNPMLIQTEYTYEMTVYNRPTIDCDGVAYGATPITSTVAVNKPFSIWLTRKNDAGNLQLSSWSVTTDSTGKASFSYTFAVGTDYEFHMTPPGNTTSGDEIDWYSTVTDPNASTSPTPAPAATGGGTSSLPLGPIALIVLFFVLLIGGGAEYWHWVRKRRHMLPEQEYQQTPKL